MGNKLFFFLGLTNIFFHVNLRNNTFFPKFCAPSPLPPNFANGLSLIQLEALRERRPPWPRQIITLILPTVKMLSLGCERLPTPLKKKKKKKVLNHYLHHNVGMLPLLFFCSFTHLTIPRSPPKFNQFFFVLLGTRP